MIWIDPPSSAQESDRKERVCRVADAVLHVDGVRRLGGPTDRLRVSTPPVCTVTGVHLGAIGATVTVVAEYPVDVVALAHRIRRRVAAVAQVERVDVVIADVHGPFDGDADRDDEPGAIPSAVQA